MPEITYGELYAYLASLGFSETPATAFEAVWKHPASGGIVMVFPLAATEKFVRGADMLSVEVRLQHCGLLEGSMQRAIETARAK